MRSRQRPIDRRAKRATQSLEIAVPSPLPRPECRGDVVHTVDRDSAGIPIEPDGRPRRYYRHAPGERLRTKWKPESQIVGNRISIELTTHIGVPQKGTKLRRED